MNEDGFEIATRKLIMYPDLSVTGRLFGGQLLSWIDESIAMMAMKKMGIKNIVTKKISEVVFTVPGKIGDVLEIWSKPHKEGKTSLSMDCKVTVWHNNIEEKILICTCQITFVAIDEFGKPFTWNPRYIG